MSCSTSNIQIRLGVVQLGTRKSFPSITSNSSNLRRFPSRLQPDFFLRSSRCSCSRRNPSIVTESQPLQQQFFWLGVEVAHRLGAHDRVAAFELFRLAPQISRYARNA